MSESPTTLTDPVVALMVQLWLRSREDSWRPTYHAAVEQIRSKCLNAAVPPIRQAIRQAQAALAKIPASARPGAPVRPLRVSPDAVKRGGVKVPRSSICRDADVRALVDQELRAAWVETQGVFSRGAIQKVASDVRSRFGATRPVSFSALSRYARSVLRPELERDRIVKRVRHLRGEDAIARATEIQIRALEEFALAKHQGRPPDLKKVIGPG